MAFDDELPVFLKRPGRPQVGPAPAPATTWPRKAPRIALKGEADRAELGLAVAFFWGLAVGLVAGVLVGSLLAVGFHP